jgi:hypothetical protein
MMPEPITIMTWLWKQEKSRTDYGPEHVNTWGRMIERNTTAPHRLSCVTDCADGIDSSIEIIPLPDTFADVRTKRWPESKGMPQCFRRLDMFRPDASKRYGSRFVSMDLDCVIAGNIDHILGRREDFIMLKGTSQKRPYNGSLVMMDAGARPEVYWKFTPERAHHASSLYIGSDQAWISYVLGWCEPKFTEVDGVYPYVRHKQMTRNPPEDLRILFMMNHIKPWSDQVKDDRLIREHYR